MKVKVCGLRCLDDLLNITELNVDYIGFIFYKNSPRYIGSSLSFEEVRRIPESIRKVGVFVNEPVYSVLNTAGQYDLDMVQLHGNETEKQCAELKKYVRVIKAFSITDPFDFSQLEKFSEHVDHFLFDSPSHLHGGSGRTFDWQSLKSYNNAVSYFLSGGIDVNSLKELYKAGIPEPFAIDINSKFEIAPGQKDINRIKEFLINVKRNENTNELQSK